MRSPRLSFSAPLLLSACCCLTAAPASAAIITERNDVYDGAGCIPPPAYTFIGTPSRPGIDSCWIPYGTYTDGDGGTEYTRVTTNLMGVVASILGGAAERAYVTGGYFSPTVISDDFGHWPTLLRPITAPPQSWDMGEYLESATNTSLRIADQFNLGIMYKGGGPAPGSSMYPVYPESIEPLLAKTDNYYGYYTFNGGIAGSFGSRVLDDLTDNAQPPISPNWTADIPFDVAKSNLWRDVWPTYAACTNDIHFFPGTNSYLRILPDARYWDIWGKDVFDARSDLLAVLTNMPLSVCLEDVLSADTGWEYEPSRLTNDYWTIDGVRLSRATHSGEWDDLEHVSYADWSGRSPSGNWLQLGWEIGGHWTFNESSNGTTVVSSTIAADPKSQILNFGDRHVAIKTELYTDTDDYVHWRNGTTRLDWKRLGIICQLERQMETTYTTPSGTDLLPFYSLTANHSIPYKTDVEVNLPIPEYFGQTETLSNLFENVSWAQDSESYNLTTNNLEWATPTCRVPRPATYSGVAIDPFSGFSVQLSEEDAAVMIASLCSQFTNDLVWASFEGEWIPREGTLVLEFLSFYAEGLVEVQVPSNTVEVATGDGFSGSESSELPIAKLGGWHFGDTLRYFDFGMTPEGSLSMDYEDLYGDLSVAYHGNGFDPLNGTFTTTQIVFSVIGGGEDPTNWVWQVSGIDGLVSNTATNDIVDVEGSSFYQWKWNWADDPTAVAAMIEMYLSGPFPYLSLSINRKGGYGLYARWGEFWSPDDPTPSQSIIIPSISATWTTSYYSKEVPVYNDDPLTYEITVVPLTETNETKGVLAIVQKDSSASFTDHTAASMGDIISRFSWSNFYWDRIKTFNRSELELLISGTGDHAMADSTSPWDGFEWEYLKQYYETNRYFRFLPGASAPNRGAAESARFIQLRDLDIACKSKCVELGGMPIDSIFDFGRITADEAALFFDNVKRAEVKAAFRVTGLEHDRYSASVLWDEDMWEYNVTGIYAPASFPHAVGWYGWDFEVKYEGITNSLYRAVRTDAHQAPVHKTLWKFKNLRDPNL